MALLILCCGTSGPLALQPPPPSGFLDGKKAAQLRCGNGRKGQATHYSQNRKKGEKQGSSSLTGSLPTLPQDMGTGARELKGVLGEVKEGPLPRVWDLLTRNTHTLSGGKSSTEAHAHTFMQTSSAFNEV